MAVVEEAIRECPPLRSVNERGWARRAVFVADRVDCKRLTQVDRSNCGGDTILLSTFFGCYSVVKLDSVGSS